MDDGVNIHSPCMNICTINSETGYCFGCYRTVKEISDWMQFTKEKRVEVMAELGLRRRT